MAKDSAAGIELGRSFHQEGTFNLKVSESDLILLITTFSKITLALLRLHWHGSNCIYLNAINL